MRVRALAFDVVGTLIDWRPSITEALAASAIAEAAGFADAWRERSFAAQAEMNAGSKPWANLDALHLTTLEELLAEHDTDLPPEQRQRLVEAWHRLPAWPDAAAGLEALRDHYLTAALSNGHLIMLVDLVRHTDLRFDCLLSAEMALAYKPASELYLTAARLLDLEPGEMMLVSAHTADLRGARRAGLRTAFIDRSPGRDPSSPVRQHRDAEESVGDLRQLAPRLG